MSSPRPVEFRLLQVRCAPVGDERRTIALLHFDGRELRFSCNRSRTPQALSHARPEIREVLDALRRRIRSITRKLQLSVGLDHIFPVLEGSSSLLTWGPLQVGITVNPEAHFNELSRMLELWTPGERYEGYDVLKGPRLGQQFLQFGERIQLELGSTNRIRTKYPVQGLRDYESPLSWLNGAWHHSFLLNLARVRVESVVEKCEHTLGRIDVSVPVGEVGVIVAVCPERDEFLRKIEAIQSFVNSKFPDRVECLSAPISRTGHPSFDYLKKRIESDVMTDNKLVH